MSRHNKKQGTSKNNKGSWQMCHWTFWTSKSLRPIQSASWSCRTSLRFVISGFASLFLRWEGKHFAAIWGQALLGWFVSCFSTTVAYQCLSCAVDAGCVWRWYTLICTLRKNLNPIQRTGDYMVFYLHTKRTNISNGLFEIPEQELNKWSSSDWINTIWA